MNNCSATPLNVALPANAYWYLTAPPLSIFNGLAGFLQAAVVACKLGYAPKITANTGMYVCDPFTPNATTGNWYVINPNLPQCQSATCPNPPAIKGAYCVNFTTSADFYAGDQVQYYCNSGLTMTGTTVPKANCTFMPPYGWTWVDQQPQCICKKNVTTCC